MSDFEYLPINREARIGSRLLHLLTRASLLAWLVLGALLFITGWISQELRARDLRYTQQEFTIQTQEIASTISQRIKAHEQILIGAAALFDASEIVSRTEWRAYIERLALPHYYPGTLAVGYSAVIQPQDLIKHTLAVRTEGFPDYQVRPLGQRDLYTSIVFIEPFAGRNLAAFGYDMFSEPVRRRAMTAAVDDNDARLSGKVTLVQENQGRVQAGLLMYIPIYRSGLPTAKASERWLALQGFVYSAYRGDDLMHGIVGQRDHDIHFEIYAAGEQDEEMLLHRSHGGDVQLAKPWLNQDIVLNLYGQKWLLHFTKMSDGAHAIWLQQDHVAAVLGTGISILMFLLISFLADERQRARSLANSMTSSIREKVETLRLNEERFRLALDSSSMGTWNWYLNNNVIYWDDSIYTLFGLQKSDNLNTYESFLALVHADDRERIFQEIANAMEGYAQYDTEYRIVWPDGSLHFIASRAKVLLDDQQTPLLMTGTCWDITERKRAERMKNEFVSTVSHELRTPLTSINGALGILTGGALDLSSKKALQLVDIAHKNTQRLHVLIDDLLDMEKLSNGKMVFDLKVVPLVPLLRRALDENKIYAEQYHVEYHLNAEIAVASAKLDELKFLQVMANLLSNAAKFSSPYSVVVVHLFALSAQRLRIAVIDKGVGIPASEQAHIFEKFYQVDGSDTRKKGGTGLGLAIAKLMVEQMNGSLGFTSVDGVGSTFYMDFNVVKEAP